MTWQILQRTVTAASIACAAILAAVFVPTMAGYEAQIVVSGSMGDAVPVGSVALTRMVEVRSVGVGDVITFRQGDLGTAVTHRVIAITPKPAGMQLTTKGDAVAQPDPEPLVLAGRVARVERVIPMVGRVVGAVRTPAGAAIAFLVPILGLAFDRGPRGLLRRGRYTL